jgi:hypothetical protein
LALALIQGCDRPPESGIPAIQAAGHALSIDLQDGFKHGHETIITIDGREVYRGTPKTDERLGLAETVSVISASTRPVVVLTVSAEGIRWSQRIDLSAGHCLGVSLSPGGQVRIVQQTNGFGYD